MSGLANLKRLAEAVISDNQQHRKNKHETETEDGECIRPVDGVVDSAGKTQEELKEPHYGPIVTDVCTCSFSRRYAKLIEGLNVSNTTNFPPGWLTFRYRPLLEQIFTAAKSGVCTVCEGPLPVECIPVIEFDPAKFTMLKAEIKVDVMTGSVDVDFTGQYDNSTITASKRENLACGSTSPGGWGFSLLDTVTSEFVHKIFLHFFDKTTLTKAPRTCEDIFSELLVNGGGNPFAVVIADYMFCGDKPMKMAEFTTHAKQQEALDMAAPNNGIRVCGVGLYHVEGSTFMWKLWFERNGQAHTRERLVMLNDAPSVSYMYKEKRLSATHIHVVEALTYLANESLRYSACTQWQ